MEVLHNGKYPDKNMIACDECNCIFRYYDSEVLIETSSLEEQEAFCGYGVTKYIKCPQCGHKIMTSCNFYPDPDPIGDIIDKFSNLSKKFIDKIFKRNKKKKGNDIMERIGILKVSSKSNPNSVAGAIAAMVKEYGKVELQAIGAGALNQAIKGIAIARGFVAPGGIDLVCIPAFADIEVEGEDRTGIKLIVKGE